MALKFLCDVVKELKLKFKYFLGLIIPTFGEFTRKNLVVGIFLPSHVILHRVRLFPKKYFSDKFFQTQ